MQNKKVGIVIPIYNVEKYLDECIQSVLNQTYVYLSIILVNDGSNDNSLNIAKKYALKDERIIIIDKKNGGLSSARNTGIDFFAQRYNFQFEKENQGLLEFKIVGDNSLNIYSVYKKDTKINQNFKIPKVDYIIFLDSDDFWKLNCIEECVKRINNVDIVWFGHDSLIEIPSEKKNKNQMQFFDYNQEQIITSIDWLKQLNSEYKPLFWFAWQGMINFNFLMKIRLKFINGIIHEDNHFGILLFSMAKYIYIYPEILYIYRVRSGSIMTQNEKTKVASDSYLYSLFIKSEQNYELFKRYQMAFGSVLTCFHVAEFIEKNKTDCLNLIETKNIFMPILLDRAIAILFLEKNLLSLLAYFERLQPYFREFKLSKAEAFKYELSYRLGYLFLNNYRSFKGLLTLIPKIKKEIQNYHLEKQNFQNNIKHFPFIEFMSELDDNPSLKRVKNHYSYKVGKILTLVLKCFGVK
ncbi:TPA: glycosyltransferase family 2 protein [Campylobacter jejuni]|nr:glycosyltransferase family 2 protein [Campylobacter jejuni]HDZ5090817.1 glycosyltransferase family 2 protein [Campylobacter jejuni]HDZ5092729.1 glycosyltransferase family 2 protein [Campylobacter jejuni]HDZ5101135.1 glycosyltransferase family 2 protein [Campylobacter jejuni]HDZ5107626.1 glycosyltransferase family 2 protein [Campylobacter jejuni]